MIRVKEIKLDGEVVPVLVVDDADVMGDWVFIDVFENQLKKAGIDPVKASVTDFEDEYRRGTKVIMYYWSWYIVECQGKYYVVEYREKETTVQRRNGIIETYYSNKAKPIKAFNTVEEAYNFINRQVERKEKGAVAHA